MKATTIFSMLISLLFAYQASASFSPTAVSTKSICQDTTLGFLSPPSSANAAIKKPGFFGKLKLKLIELIAGKEDLAQTAENGKAKKKKWGLIIAIVLLVGGLAALVIALGNMRFH